MKEGRQREYDHGMLPTRMTAIYSYIGTGHHTGRWRHEENCGSSEVLWLAQLTEHVLSRPVDPSLRMQAKQLLHHCCNDIARGYGIDADAMLSPLRCQVPGQLNNASFRGIVRRTYESLEIRSEQNTRHRDLCRSLPDSQYVRS